MIEPYFIEGLGSRRRSWGSRMRVIQESWENRVGGIFFSLKNSRSHIGGVKESYESQVGVVS